RKNLDTTGNDTFVGGAGNDFLYGGAGSNTFGVHQNWGQDTIMDWMAGTGNVIDMTALAAQGVHSLADLSQSVIGGSDVITHGADEITLNAFGSTLGAGSFLFA